MSKPISILQVTDTHLFADKSSSLLGINTFDSLQLILKQIFAEGRKADFMLLTGDLSQDGSVESYQHLLEQFQDFDCPMYTIPGNHDQLGHMDKVLKQSYMQPEKVIDFADWRFVLLDSHVPNEVHGHLDSQQLEFLDEALSMSEQQHHLVVLHHQPIDIKTAWLDTIGLDNKDDFHRIIKKYPTIRGVLWGHIHQDFQATQEGILYLATPSTCIQFTPNVVDFAVHDINPGYRWIECHTDGTITTTAHRLQGVTLHPDINSAGY